MKKSTKVITLILTIVLIYALVSPTRTISENYNEIEAKDTLISYLDSLKNKDIKKTVKLCRDIRVESDKELEESLKERYEDKDNHISYYIIGEAVATEGENYKFDVELKYVNGDGEKSTLNVLREKNKYIVEVGYTTYPDWVTDPGNFNSYVEVGS